MDERIQRIEQKLEGVERKIDETLKLLHAIKTGTDKMSGHVDFVDEVYESVQTPFHNLMNLTDQYFSTKSIAEK
jgi:archaellum component FlaC